MTNDYSYRKASTGFARAAFMVWYSKERPVKKTLTNTAMKNGPALREIL
jgi:hypothetical protein